MKKFLSISLLLLSISTLINNVASGSDIKFEHCNEVALTNCLNQLNDSFYVYVNCVEPCQMPDPEWCEDRLDMCMFTCTVTQPDNTTCRNNCFNIYQNCEQEIQTCIDNCYESHKEECYFLNCSPAKDADKDGIPDDSDNCPTKYNPDQNPLACMCGENRNCNLELLNNCIDGARSFIAMCYSDCLDNDDCMNWFNGCLGDKCPYGDPLPACYEECNKVEQECYEIMQSQRKQCDSYNEGYMEGCCSATCTETFAKEIIFNAKPANKLVQLTWTAISEMDILGYNIFRADKGSSTFKQINVNLISAKGSIETTVEYSYRDTDVQNRNEYIYKLVEVQTNGETKEHGLVSVTPRLLKGIFQ